MTDQQNPPSNDGDTVVHFSDDPLAGDGSYTEDATDTEYRGYVPSPTSPSSSEQTEGNS